MTSTVGKTISAVHRPIGEPDGSGRQPGEAPGPACEALCRFLLSSLAASQETIDRTLEVQQRMMDVVSRHIFGPIGADRPDLGPDERDELVTALQSDDLIRQTYENLSRVLAVMARAVEEVAGSAGGEGASVPSQARWNADLQDVLLMDELRQRFASKHETPEDG